MEVYISKQDNLRGISSFQFTHGHDATTLQMLHPHVCRIVNFVSSLARTEFGW